MNVNRQLSPEAREHLRGLLALDYPIATPYAGALAHYSNAKLFSGIAAANHLFLAILRRRRNAQGFRWVGGYAK